MKLRAVLFFSCLAILQGSGLAQSDPKQTQGNPAGIRKAYFSDNKKQDRLDLFIDSLVRNYMSSPQNSGLSIAVIDTGDTRFFNYGEASPGVNVSNQTVFETGSVSHAILGLLLSNAIVEKKINPMQDIRHFLCDSCTGLHYHSKAVLVQDLAFHSSGLDRYPFNLYKQQPYDSLNPLKNYTKELFQIYLSSVKPTSMPGQGVSYSMMNSAILGHILETVYSKPLNELIREKISGVLQLSSTRLDSIYNLAQGRDQNGVPVPTWKFGAIPAAGGICSTTEELARIMRYQLGSSEVAKTNLKVFKVGQQLANYSCFTKLNSQSEKFYWQNVGTGGFSVFYGFVKEAKVGLIILSNSSMSVEYLALQILKFHHVK